MADQLRFDGRVAIVTGAGNGLGRSHALLLASRGAKVVVNDLGGGHTGGGKSSAAADKVVEEIKAAGGEAVANYDSVEDGAKIVQTALDTWKRVDIVINNAGILRDTSFKKLSPEDWDLIYRVHVLGAYRVTKAAWDHMQEAGFGRIIFTASAAGIYGNFGQSNYSMAKLGVVGFANTLALEGAKKNVRVNTIAPIAGSRMTETVLPKELIDALRPEYVSPLVAYLCHESCEETGGLFEVGGGFMAKLRWERTEGKTFRLGQTISPEKVQSAFGQITDFAKSTHPADINQALAPVMENVNAPRAKGGNEFIDVDQALGWESPELISKHDERDLSLYALGVGAAQDPLDAKDLALVYELHGEGFKPLPTYAVNPVIAGVLKMASEGKNAPGLNYGLDRILHGEQFTELFRPFPPKATLKHKGRIKDIFDKGKHALVITSVDTFDAETNELIARNEITTFVRGAGGWGGDRGPVNDVPVPDRKPDAVITEKTHENQALLYRLSGDWNPLHADPEFAQAFGFPKPILHGLCTFGYVGRHAIKAFAPNGDPRYFKSIRVRFADTVFPGETLQTELWKESEGRVVLRTKVLERDKVVLNNAAVEFYKEIPRGAAKPVATQTTTAPAAAPAAASTSASNGAPGSAVIFEVIKGYIARNPDTAKIGNVYHFKLKNPASEWTLDLKNGAGSVSAGAPPAKADCVLELEDADWVAMATGKADPQKLYFGGKLKITGNVMASQKLDFLKKIDPAEAAKLAGGSAGAPAAAGSAATSAAAAPAHAAGGAAPSAAMIFEVIKAHVAKNPDLTKVGCVYHFKLKNPASEWTLDLKNGAGAVSAGAPAEKAGCVLELEDADWVAMATGKADPQKLYFGGKLKITGNVMASQKLDFLKKIDPSTVATVANPPASVAPSVPSSTAPASAPTSSQPKAPAIFDALQKRLGANPNLATEVNAVLHFKVTSPDGLWTVNLQDTPGVKQGTADKATTVITIADEDLVELVKDPQSAKALYQRGQLRVDGDVTVAQRLGFLKQLV